MKTNKETEDQSIIAVDIGNTAVHMALLKGMRVVSAIRTPSHGSRPQMKKDIAAAGRAWGKAGRNICGGVICSVVPSLTARVEGLCREVFSRKFLVVGRDVVPPIKNRYRVPAQVGDDRLVGAFAAKRLYGQPLIVIDLGTATTFDVVSLAGDYLGGVIVPGVGLSAETLSRSTALLPLVQVRKPRALIARDTENSILSGLYYGYGEMIKGIIIQIKKQLPSQPRVVLTGGYAPLYRAYIKNDITHVDEALIFKGMALLWRRPPAHPVA